jgi:hypothetical protein
VYWSDENPHVALDDHKQTDPRINVWCGIHGDAILTPVFLDNKLTGVRYRQHVENTLQLYLDETTLTRAFDFTSSRMEHRRTLALFRASG